MKEILEILNKNGYEAFIVGGYVRDYLLGISSYDVDISTNAPIEEIEKMFKGKGKSFPQYFAYHISDGDYEYDITTYRKELRYKKNKPVEIKKAKNLGEDLLRRDFTINTFAMDSNGYFVDLLGAKKDFNSKIIKCVGDTNQKLEEDKTRIIRALRFACTLDFDLSSEIIDFISKKSYMLNEVPKEYKKKELDRIFDSRGVDKFLYYLKRYDIQKYFDIKFDEVVPSYNKYGIWAQVETDLPFSNEEQKKINAIKKIVDRKELKMLDIIINSDDVVMNSAYILNQVDKVKIMREINNLHSIIEIDVDIDVFFELVPLSEIVKTYRLVEKNIVEGYLANNRDDIIEFIEDL